MNFITKYISIFYNYYSLIVLYIFNNINTDYGLNNLYH